MTILRLRFWRRPFPILVMMLLLGGLVPAVIAGSSRARPAADFTLTNQFGETVTLSRFRGRTVVLTFLYTDCPTLCPAYVARLRSALDQLDPETREHVTVLAVTVDPDRDTPGQLQAHGRVPDTWHYLTGPRLEVEKVWRDYGVWVLAGRGGEAGAREIMHTGKLVVIDSGGYRQSEFGGRWDAQEFLAALKGAVAGTGDPRSPVRHIAFPDIRQLTMTVASLCGPIPIRTLGTAILILLHKLTILLGLLMALYLLWRTPGRHRPSTGHEPHPDPHAGAPW